MKLIEIQFCACSRAALADVLSIVQIVLYLASIKYDIIK